MIHKFQQDDYRIVLDVNSGSVHVVDSIVYDILDYYEDHNIDYIILRLREKYPKDEILEGIEEIKNLEQKGLLFTRDTYKDNPTFLNRKPVIKALCLHIAHDCNIRCKYCFASQGDFRGPRGIMSEEIAYKAIDFLIENSGNRKNLEVDFFGGEPLLNFQVVKNTISYGRKVAKKANKRFRFTITTNGVLLDDEITDYINENMDNIVLSIDGRKVVNDNMRFTINGKGTYDIIVPKFKKLVNKRKDKSYFVRGTFTKNNLDFAKDVLHLADLGFSNTSVEPVVTEDSKDYAITKDDIPVIFNQYEILAREYIKRYKEKKFNFFHFQLDLQQGPCISKRVSGCGAGSEYLAITPEGDIYPCHQFVGQNNFLMGNITKNNFDKSLGTIFSNSHVYNKEKCNNCWAKFYCSGGCHANAYNFNNNINEPYDLGCEMEKKRIECSLTIQAKLYMEDVL